MSRTTTKIIIAQEDGTVVGQYFLGDGEHLIGREGHCTIQLEADHVSRQHARLIISAEAIEIEDLDSTSGTYLDGVTVKGRIPIQPGQKLWISDLYIDIERQGFGGLVEGSRLGDGRFTLKRELGKGGMGAVWLALDEDVPENVALKLVSGEISLDPECLKELQREVNKSHKLVHPNIVRMGYFWKEEGEPAFISLEYVDGTDLHQLRSASPNGLLAWKEVQSYMLQLCDALEYAHTQKVAHRDIKPSNFMITSEGNLKLADFGIAASLTSSSLSFTSSSVLGSGTPPYMSPQQLEGKRPQVTDDIYSVGATFYELLTSKPPFYQGDISYQVRHTEAAPMGLRLRELGLSNDIPEYVSAIVMACLQKDRGKRPQSMRVIREWIASGEEVAVKAETVAPAAARETQTLQATPSAATTRNAPARRSRKKWAYGIASVVILILIGLTVFYCLGKKSLSLNDEQLTVIPKRLNYFPNLRFLNLGFNKLTTVKGLEKLTQLTVLNLYNNKLTSVKGLEKLTQLTVLGLNNNPDLTKAQIDQLQKALPKCKIFSNPTKIGSSTAVTPQPTPPTTVPANTFNPIIEKEIRRQLIKRTGELTTADLKKVTRLILERNQLTEIPKGLEKLTKLRTLYLRGNQLTSVTGLEKLTQLKELLLYDNQLTDVTGLEKLTQLRTLDLGGNQLTSVTGLEKLTQLGRLTLYGNQLTDVKGLEKLTQLTHLWLDGNQLTDVKGLEKLTQLTHLYLLQNQLTDVKGLEKLTKLKELHLSYNKLTDVKGLEKLTKLTLLALAGNSALTVAQIDELRIFVPNCKVISNPSK